MNSLKNQQQYKYSIIQKQIKRQKMKSQQVHFQKYHVGQNLDIKDSVGKWINAQVLFVGHGTIYVHYSGWSAKYDQSIPIESNRILEQWEKGKQIRLNNRIDAYHPIGGWLQARVIGIQGVPQKQQGKDHGQKCYNVKVHFFNYHPKYDIVVNIYDNSQVAIIGSRSKAFGMGKKRARNTNQASLSQLVKKILQQRARNLKKNLQQRDLTIKKSAGDGNCLFRSISDQLYGTEDHHAQIRKLCTDYISYEKVFFQDYVAGDISEYVEKMRQDGTWGDDIQIQAISEIYSRPIEIYVFGSKPIRTFHEDNENNIEPIRLAYVGSCHYDSIKPKDQLDKSIMTTQFGNFEQMFLDTYRSDLMNNILRNRSLFSNSNRLEDTIEQQLLAQDRQEVKIEDELVKALEASQTEAILQQIEKSQLRELENKYEQERIHEQLRKIEEKQLQEAKKLSAALDKNVHTEPTKPYWFDSLQAQGFTQQQIWFAIQCKGFDPDSVLNFLLDNS